MTWITASNPACFFWRGPRRVLGGTIMRLVTAVSLMLLVCGAATGADRDAERIVARQVQSIVPLDGAGGVAVALRLDGRTSFFNYGCADRAGERSISNHTRATPAC